MRIKWIVSIQTSLPDSPLPYECTVKLLRFLSQHNLSHLSYRCDLLDPNFSLFDDSGNPLDDSGDPLLLFDGLRLVGSRYYYYPHIICYRNHNTTAGVCEHYQIREISLFHHPANLNPLLLTILRETLILI
jgi:hypothetical protein